MYLLQHALHVLLQLVILLVTIHRVFLQIVLLLRVQIKNHTVIFESEIDQSNSQPGENATIPR